jgi:hypothetical protein
MQGKLSGERVACLEAVGFVWDPLEAAWANGFEYLEQFVSREGHTIWDTKTM